MAKKILISYDFQLNEIQNAKAHIIAGDPGSPVEGQFWYNSVTHLMKWMNDTGPIDPLARANHSGTQSADTLTDGTTNKAFLATERTKLAGIATGATLNSTDAYLLARENHTGTQSADTVVDGSTNHVFTAADDTKLAGIATAATANDTDANLRARSSHTGTQLAATISDFGSAVLASVLTGLSTATNAVVSATDTVLVAFGKVQAQVNAHFGAGGTAHADVVAAGASGFMTGADKTKLNGIATGATANDTDANLLARANHTGTQSADTITDGSTNHVFTAGDDTKLAGIATGATANDTDANLRARSSHTGTQLASTISDFDTQVRTNTLSQMGAPTGDVSINGHKLTSVADGTGAQDAATYGQLLSIANGRAFKDAVRAATTENITLSGTQTIDDVSVIAGDRVLVKNQSTASQNGIYVCAGGAWSRSTDTDNTSVDTEVKTGMTVGISEGTAHADQQWTLTTNGAITVGTTGLTFALTGGNAMYTQSTGITITGSAIAVDTAVVVRKYAVTLGDGVATSITVTHNLGTKDITYSLRQASDDVMVDCDVTSLSTTQTTFTFALAPANNSLRAVIHG